MDSGMKQRLLAGFTKQRGYSMLTLGRIVTEHATRRKIVDGSLWNEIIIS